MTPAARRRAQRKVLQVLAAGQVLGGLGTGASLSLGALLVTGVAGSSAWSGMSATMSTLGAAVVAVPLARLAQARGRRISLSTGAFVAVAGGLLVIGAAVIRSLPLLLVAIGLVGSGQALNLQARFAATDLASDRTRGRDLGLVVWSTTVGAVAGPNLFGPGEVIGRYLGLPSLTGGFVIAAIAQLAGAAVYLAGLRPDPLLTAANEAIGTDPAGSGTDVSRPSGRRSPGGLALLRGSARARRAVLSVAMSHAAMVALMSMTPVHLSEHGASLTVIGFTISVHIAGMYALSPVFGHLADRLGRRSVILGGQGLFLASLFLALVGSQDTRIVTASLVLLGLGWSAATVAGSAQISEAVAPPARAPLQGSADMVMNLVGAIGGAVAGPVLALVGFSGLSAVLLIPIAVVVVAQGTDRTRDQPPAVP